MPLPLLLFLTACQPTIGKTGTKTTEYFPMDGSRWAEYISDDAAITYTLTVEKIQPVEVVDGAEVVTFEHSWSGDTFTTIGAVKWSAKSGEGIKVHAWTNTTDGSFTTFDTPVQVTDENDYMNPGESVVTETNDMTFTSTFIGFSDCPVQWGLEWEGCLHLDIDDGDGDDAVGPIFAGEYWLVTRYGAAWMKLTGDNANWNLADYDWDTGG